jgi:hypothetical protein
MITVEKLFDDGENVLGRNPDVTFLHIDILILLLAFGNTIANIVPKLSKARLFGDSPTSYSLLSLAQRK